MGFGDPSLALRMTILIFWDNERADAIRSEANRICFLHLLTDKVSFRVPVQKCTPSVMTIVQMSDNVLIHEITFAFPSRPASGRFLIPLRRDEE